MLTHGDERTLIAYDVVLRNLAVEQQTSRLDPAANKMAETAPLPLAADETLKLHIDIDHSVIEVFANKRIRPTSRVYPSRSDSAGVSLVAFGGRVGLKSLDLWTLNALEFSQWTPTTG